LIKLLNSKVAFITALFGAFGFVLINIFDIKNLPTFVTSMGMLFSLVLSFICSTLLLTRINVSKRKWLILTSTGLFVISVLLFFKLQEKIDMLTVDLEQFSGDSTLINRYFKGTVYNREAYDYKANNPGVTDEELTAVSENNIYNVWTTDSVKLVVRETTLIYYLFIFSIVLSISILTEILNKSAKTSRPRKSKRTVV
jgi:hypothetical protein